MITVSILEYDGPEDYGVWDLEIIPRMGEVVELDNNRIFRVRDIRHLLFGKLVPLKTSPTLHRCIRIVFFVQKL